MPIDIVKPFLTLLENAASTTTEPAPA